MALNGLPINLEVGLTGVNSASRTLDNLTNQRRVVQLSARLDTRSILSAQKALGQISNNASEFEKSMQAANARVLAFGSAVGVIEGMRRSFVALIKTTVDVENALIKIASISQDSLSKAGISIDQYGRQLFKIARETGQTFDEVGKAALEFARQGLKPVETLERTRDALVLTRLSGLDAVASVEALTAAYNTFKNEVSGTNEILQKLVAVDNASAASAGDLAEGLQRAGFIAKESGQNLDEMIATIAVLQEATARGGAVVGNAFKTILTRAQSLENLKLFESLGIDTSVEGKIKPVITLLQELSNVINDPSFTQNKTPILSQLAGNFQINQLSAFLSIVKDIGNQGSRYTETVERSKNATNEATKQNEAYGKAVAASLNTAKLSVEEFLNSLGKVGIKDPFAGLIEKVSSFFNFIQGAVDSEGLGGDIARGIVKGIGGVLFSNTGLLLVASALVKIGYDFAKFAKDAAVGFLDFNRSGKEQERIQTSISNILATERGILDGISNTEAGRVILAQRVANIYKEQLSSALAISQLTQGAAAQLYNQGARIKGGTVTGLRSANGFDPLVSAEMRDVKRGVGGASPNSKIVVMPNFPFGGGKKGLMVANSSEKAYKAGDGYGIMNPNQMRNSGRAADGFKFGGGSIRNQTGFADQKSLGTAITLMVNSAIMSGKSSKELAAVVNKTIGGFNLVRESFQKVSKEANVWANAMFKQAQQANAQQRGLIAGSAGRLNTGGTGFTSSPQVLGLGFRRPASEGPLQGDPFNVANLPQFESERLQTTRATKARLSIDNERRRAQQAEQKKLLDERKSLAGRLNERELALGERKNFLSRLKGRKEDVVVNGRSLSASDARRLFSGELSNISKQAASLRSSLTQKDKELFEKFGFDPTQSRPTRISEGQRADQQALKARLQEKYSGGSTMFGGSGGGSRTLSGLKAVDQKVLMAPVSAGEIEKTKKTFSDSLGKLFVLSIAAEGLGAAFGDAEGTISKFSEFASKATLGLVAISEFSNFGGKSIKDFIPSFGEGKSNLARGFAAGRTGADLGNLASSRSARFGRSAGAFVGGAANLGKGLLGALPVIGQVVIGLGILYEGIKIFSPNFFEGVRLAFGGLTKSAENAQKGFDEFATKIFSESGEFKGASRADRSSSLSSSRTEEIQRLRAISRGVDIKDKTQQQIEAESFGKLLFSYIKDIQTGSTFDVATGRRSDDPVFGVVETLGNIGTSAEKILTEVLAKITSGTDEDVRKLAKEKGIEIPASANREDINKAISQNFVQGLVKSVGGKQRDFSDFFKRDAARAFTSGFGADFLGSGATEGKSAAPKLRPSEQEEVVIASQRISSLFEEKEAILGISTAQERRRKVEQQLGEISSRRNVEIDNELKLLEFQRNVQRENLTIAERIFEEVKKEAELKEVSGKIPLAKSQAAQKTFGEIDFSEIKSITAGIQKIREDLTGNNTVVGEINGKLQTQLDSRKVIQEITKKQIEGDGKDALQIEKANSALRAQNRLLEIQRQSKTTEFSGRAIGFDATILQLQNQAGRANTSAASRRGIEGQINSVEIQKLEDQKLQKLEETSQKIFDLRASQKSKGIGDKELEKSIINETAALQNFNAETDSQIENLKRLSSQLEETESSSTSFANALDSFSRGRGSARGQNQFNALQATDPSSIVSGLIGEQVYGQAEGKSGANAVSFIAEQNALLNEAFKIKTATSQVEKLNLETQLELTKEILAIKNSDLSATEKQAAIEKAITDNLAQRRTFSFGVKEARAGMRDEVNQFGSDFGKTATTGFKDALVGAMDAATSATGNLRDALLNVALDFANSLKKAALNNLANIIVGGGGSGGGGAISSIVGAIGNFFTGGKKAAGGLITGGSGSKDDVPTLLMGGEYVVNKKAVNAYGRNFFESLNNGSVGQMAQGGYFAPGVRGQGTISGKENLLDFATQTATTGKGDVVSSLGAGAGLVSLEPESLRLSNFGRFGDSPIVQATQEAKEQAFGLYLDQLGAEKDYQNQLDQIKKAEKAKKKQLLMSLAVAAVSAGLSYGAGKLNFGKTIPKALRADLPAVKNSSTGLYQSVGGSLTKGIADGITGAFRATAYGNADIDPTTAKDQALANSGNPAYKGFSQTVGASGRTLVPGYSVASNRYPLGTILQVNGQSYRVDDRGGMSKNVVDFYAGSDRNLYNKFANFGKINPQVLRRNSGGSVSGSGDTVPAMLSNKEFVLNSSAAQKIGDKGLYALNSGANPSGGDSEARIVSKLDELIEKTIGASNITISVSMGSEGGDKTDNSQQGDSNTNEKQRFLVQRLKETVIGVIRDEQRPGGLLTSTKR